MLCWTIPIVSAKVKEWLLRGEIESLVKVKKKTIYMILVIIVIATLWTIWGNVTLGVTNITITSENLPAEFVNYRIAQVSDLHNAEFGKGNEKLLALLAEAKPDMIALTGDIIDSNHTDVEISLQFVEEAVKIAPCYYITGNHEAWISESIYTEMEQQMLNMGVRVLHNNEAIIEKNGAQISLIGMDDPTFARAYNRADISRESERIKELSSIDGFTILLSHRPEYFEQYVEADVDLVLSGHVHGGQFRLPIVGGLVGPNQGLFPEYDAGVFTEDNTNMIVSRGIGNSVISVRFNNRPEIIIMELK